MSTRVAKIVLDTTGEMNSRPVTYIVTISETADVTALDIRELLRGLRLGPFESEGGIIDVTVGDLPTLEAYITDRYHALIAAAGSDVERIRLTEQLQVKRQMLRDLGLHDRQ